MEILIIILLVICAVWFFTFGSYKTSIKDPATLTETELEDAFIELKKNILTTNVYEQKQAYERLYRRIFTVLVQILDRHRHFVLDFEAKRADVRRIFIRREYRDAYGGLSEEYVVPNDFDFEREQSDELLYICFFLYLGGRAQGIGSVNSNPRLMVKILDYLINERQYYTASFFKGFVMKYGIEFYRECYPGEARTLLEFAQQNGVGAASIELQQLNKYTQLEGIKSVNTL